MTDASELARLRRMVRQELESLQRAGVSHMPRSAPLADRQPAPSAAGGTAMTTTAVRVESARSAEDQTEAAPATDRRSEKKSLFAAAEADEAAPVATGFEILPRDERCRRLEGVAERVAACTRCSELASTRTQTVFGVGDPQARILFIGEAPGADEDRQGEPFVGKAGQLLNKIIEASRLKREEVYICNVLKCRPPGNRTPLPDEAAHCREYLEEQIAVVAPDYIVCWGAVAAQNLLGTTLSIGRLRGRFHQYQSAKVLCTYHPSYLLRNPAAKKDVWEDMKLLRRDMGVEL